MDNALKAWQEKYKPADTAQKEKAQTALDQWKQRYSPATAPEQPEPKAAAAGAFLATANVGETAKETLRNKETGKLLKNAIGTAEQEVVRSGGTRESEEFLTRRKDAYNQWKKEQIGKATDLWAEYADQHALFSVDRIDSQKGKTRMDRMNELREQLKLHIGIDDEQLDDILDTYKLTPVEELNYLAGKAITGGASGAQGSAQMLHKLFYDDLAILGSLVDATTGVTNTEKKLQEVADRSFDIDVFGADKLREYNEQLYADKYIPKTTQFLGGLAESAGAMLPAIATSNAAGMLGVGANAAQALNYLSFGSGAAGNAAKQALEEGADMRDAVQYGLYSGMLEVLSESMFAGIAGMNESALMDDILDKLSKNGTIRFLMDTLGEGVEEGVVAFLEPYIRRATIDPEAAPATAREILEAAASGVALSAIMNGAAVATSGPAAVFGSQKGTQEQMILQDKYGRVEESTVKDVLSKPPVTKEQEKAAVQPAAPQEEEIPKMELAGPEAFEPASKTEQQPTEEIPKMELEGIEETAPAAKAQSEEIPKMELAGEEAFETPKADTAGETQRQTARKIGDMLEGTERTRYSPQELGVEHGGDAALITLLTDQQVKQIGLEDATRIAEDAGYTPVFYSGLMVMEDGQISRWAKSGKHLYIQADSAVQSAAEIAKAAVKVSGISAVTIRPAEENTKTATADISTGKQATYFGTNAGLIKDDNWKAANLSSKTSRQLEALGKVTGTRIRLVPQITDENGNEANARYLNGEIQLSLKANDPVMVSAIHEAVHRLKETDADAYNALAAFVRENMSKEAFQSVLDKTGKRYSGESLDSITEEVVADGLGRVLADSNVLEQFVQDNRNAAQKLADVLRDIVNAIRRALQHQNLELTAEQRADFAELSEHLSAAEQALSQALKTAQQTTQTREETKNAVTEGGERFSRDSSTSFVVHKYYNRIVKNIENQNPTGYTLVGSIPESGALYEVGFPSGDVYFDNSKILGELQNETDPLPKEYMQRVPEVLKDPVVIVESNKKNTASVFGEVWKNNVPIVVGIMVAKDRSGRNVITKVRTVHTRGHAQSLINDDTILFLNKNKKKTRAWFQASRITMPLGGTKFGLIRTLPFTSDIVKMLNDEARNSLKYSRKETETDSADSAPQENIPDNSMETTDDLVEYVRKRNEGDATRRVTPELLAENMSNNQEKFTGGPTLQRLGVKVVNSIGQYKNVDQMLANARAHKTLVRERKKYEERMKTTAKEKNFARGIADGIYNISEINPEWDRKVIETLSEWYMAERNFGELYITQVKHAIKRDVDEATDAIFDGIDDSKVDHALVLNHRTATRNMTKMFGAEKGAQINRWLFEPVTQNEAERIRFINRQFDKVRTFEDQQGKQRPLNKQERELVQRVIEYRVAAEAVEKLKNSKDIKDAAYNLMRGEDIGDLGLEFGLTFEEQTLTRNYVKWLETQNMLETQDSTIIYNAADTYAELFDTYYDAINEFLAAHGYQPIGFIKGYVPHLQPEKNQNMLQKTLQNMGINVDAVSIPTSIAGLTGDYKPNKKWNPYFLHRNSEVTQYDIVEAFESYVSNMSDVLYHTDDIMRIRSAVRHFRREYSPEEIRSAIDWAESLRNFSHDDKVSFLLDEGVISNPKISKEAAKESLAEFIEKQYSRIEETHKYNNLVMWLDNYANILAGKQSVADRSSEYTLGRKILNLGNKLTRTFSRANVAGNISSALNNSAQLPVILAENGIKNSTAAFWDIVSGKLRKAAWAEESDFLTGKRGVNFIVTTPGEMTLSVFYKPMEWVDSLLSTMAVRGAYLRGIKQGMDHAAAMRFADKYAAEVMADRSKGAKPLAFNAKHPVSAMIHLFQVEALNSWEHIAQDLPRDFKQIAAQKGKKKAAAALAGVLTKMLIYAFVMNRLAEKLYGGTPAMFDIVGLTANFIASGEGLSTNEYLEAIIDKVLLELFGETLFDTDEDEFALLADEFNLGAGLEDLTYNVSNEIPFVRNLSALFGLGDATLPLPNLKDPVEDVFTGIKDRNVLAALDAVVKGLGEIVPGGRQAVKTYTGIQTAVRGGKMFGFGEKKRLQYPAERTAGNVAKAVLFGPSALESARSYYARGNTTLTEKETDVWELLVENGVDEEEAYRVVYATKGENVSEADKLQIMSAAKDWDDALKYEAMKTVVEESSGYKLDVLQEYSVPAELYVEVKIAAQTIAEERVAAMPEEDRPEKVRPAQEDAEKALKAISGVDKNTKAVIWQMFDAGWSHKKNPYSKTTGEKAKKRHDEIKEAAEEDDIPKMQLAGLD